LIEDELQQFSRTHKSWVETLVTLFQRC
jgi:hypothetical protein